MEVYGASEDALKEPFKSPGASMSVADELEQGDNYCSPNNHFPEEVGLMPKAKRSKPSLGSVSSWGVFSPRHSFGKRDVNDIEPECNNTPQF